MVVLGPAALAANRVGAEDRPVPAAARLTLAECIAIAQQNQPAIQAAQAGVGIAGEQQKIARSYLLPHLDLTTRFTQLNRGLSVDITDPLKGNILGDVFTDAFAFFTLAKIPQVGPAGANLALANPQLPPFSTLKQLGQLSLPPTFRTELLGERFITNEVLLTQPLYTGGKIRYRNEQAKLGIQGAAEDVAKARQQTTFEVRRAYYSVLLALELVRVAEEAAGQFKAVEDLADSLLRQGDEYVTRADLYRARALRLAADSEHVRFQKAVELAYAGLRAAMGVDPQQPLRIAEDHLEFRPVAVELAGLIARAYEQRPEVIRASLAVRAAGLEQKLARAQFHPDFGLFGRFSSINDDRSYPNPNYPTQWAAGVEARWSLLAGGRRLAERRKADDLVLLATQALRAVQQVVALEVEQAYLEYREMAERLVMAAKAVQDAKGALRVYDALYEADAIAAKDMPKHFENLLTTRLLLSAAQAGYYQHLHAYYVAVARIRLATASPDPETSHEMGTPDRGPLPPPSGLRDDGQRSEETGPGTQNSHLFQPAARDPGGPGRGRHRPPDAAPGGEGPAVQD
jgi:outer membrane protein TolC